jgi:hypothetical protein
MSAVDVSMVTMCDEGGWHVQIKHSRASFRLGTRVHERHTLGLEWGNCRLCDSTLAIPLDSEERGGAL